MTASETINPASLRKIIASMLELKARRQLLDKNPTYNSYRVSEYAERVRDKFQDVPQDWPEREGGNPFFNLNHPMDSLVWLTRDNEEAQQIQHRFERSLTELAGTIDDTIKHARNERAVIWTEQGVFSQALEAAIIRLEELLGDAQTLLFRLYFQSSDLDAGRVKYWAERTISGLEIVGLTGGAASIKRALNSVAWRRPLGLVNLILERISDLEALWEDMSAHPEHHFPPVDEGTRLTTEGGYDIAQVCTQGHVITWYYLTEPTQRSAYCEQCGGSTVITCTSCGAKIKGGYVSKRGVVGAVAAEPERWSSYCGGCGQPYPWTRERLESIEMLIDMASGMNDKEKEELKQLLPALATDVPKTNIAIIKFKGAIKKTKELSSELAIKLFVEVCTKLAAEALFNSAKP